MKEKNTHYEVVSVLSRDKDGRVMTWYSQGVFASERQATAEAVRLSKQNHGYEYQVTRVEVTEIGEPKLREKSA